MKSTDFKSQTVSEHMLSCLEEEVAKFGITVEFSSSISTFKPGRNRPPCVLFYTQDLNQAYKIHLASVLAADLGHAWKVRAFFPSVSERLDAAERKPGELRFIVEPIVKMPTLVQLAYERFKPYEFRAEMRDLTQALNDVNTPGWLPPEGLTKRGFVTKQE